jgi:hypothetical protein
LWSHVLDEDLAGGDDAGDVGKELIAVLEGRAGGGVVDADTVVIAGAGCLGDGTLDVLDGRSWADRKGSRKILDGFLGC